MRFTAPAIAAVFSASVFFASPSARADEPAPYGPPTLESVQVDVTKTPDVKERADVFALGGDDEYRWICTAPCNTSLPMHTPIAVRLEKSDDPARATLTRRLGSNVEVTVSPPSTVVKTAGWVTLGIGLAAVTASIITMAAFASMDDKASRGDSPVVLTPTALGVIIGVPIGLVGLVLTGASGAMLAAASDAPSLKVTPRRVGQAP